mmetsp:Transcript_40719/g.95569  ORF Transcript_40719/g.95569 Transcript_40719/m.95569 type:complete len:183 (-) Transcript_40719:367-915(-)
MISPDHRLAFFLALILAPTTCLHAPPPSVFGRASPPSLRAASTDVPPPVSDRRTHYQVLKVDERAKPADIKKVYRKLSRKYHPDTFAQRGILPGNCDSEEEVREEWYRIKESYEILSDRKARLRYDRSRAVDDPARALGKVAVSTLSWGIAGIGVGLFKVAETAVEKMSGGTEENNSDEDAV